VIARDADRESRVRRVIALGARIADPADPLGREARADLLATSGLSREGVDLALAQHLETSAPDAEIASLLASCAEAPRCHVVLAANVCTAALRAVALAFATAPSISVRPSRRDPGLAPILARELAFPIAGNVAASPGDEVHAYGSDEALAAIRASLAPGVIFRGHGTGLGVAVVDRSADLAPAAEALAADVIAFDQRGCLSPRFALVDGDAGRAAVFAKSLHQALLAAGGRVPRGPLDEATRSAIALYLASIAALGETREGLHHAIALDPAPRALLLPPAARVVHVAPARVESANALLASWARYLTAIGGEGALAASIATLAPAARRSALGRMQRPPLDGPVDQRASAHSTATGRERTPSSTR
jgi:Acyl-CoA reductase (LuxC)